MKPTDIHIAGDTVTIEREGQTAAVALDEFLARLALAVDTRPGCGFYPDGVRAWLSRGDAVAVAVEVPPHARTVRWLLDDSEVPFGRGARYGAFFLAFPYVVLLLVFRRGGLTGFQQLYYRRQPLAEGAEDLLLPNLYNVADANQQRCWVCLAQLHDVSRLPWPDKLRAIVGHVFTAAWNRSAEWHEGNSYAHLRDLDPRLKTAAAWEAATRENPRFALDVPWPAAETTATAELTRMLDLVVAPTPLANADDLAALLVRTPRRRARA